MYTLRVLDVFGVLDERWIDSLGLRLQLICGVVEEEEGGGRKRCENLVGS